MMIKLIHKALGIPIIFELQQRICNDYTKIEKNFRPELSIPTGKFLDVGCSTGTCGGTILNMNLLDYLGIDLVQPYLSTAQSRYPNGRYAVMDAQALALATDIFHIVLFNGVLHHMDNNLAQHSLIEAGRVLRKDGYILVAEPVFTPGNVLSSFLLKHDRGNFIRTANEYKSLFGYLSIRREGYFPFSLHRFYFAVLENKIH